MRLGGKFTPNATAMLADGVRQSVSGCNCAEDRGASRQTLLQQSAYRLRAAAASFEFSHGPRWSRKGNAIN